MRSCKQLIYRKSEQGHPVLRLLHFLPPERAPLVLDLKDSVFEFALVFLLALVLLLALALLLAVNLLWN
jgi:hypothetical protein